jgi:hypothetical protein
MPDFTDDRFSLMDFADGSPAALYYDTITAEKWQVDRASKEVRHAPAPRGLEPTAWGRWHPARRHA